VLATVSIETIKILGTHEIYGKVFARINYRSNRSHYEKPFVPGYDDPISKSPEENNLLNTKKVPRRRDL